jgi:hypothetical protein
MVSDTELTAQVPAEFISSNSPTADLSTVPVTVQNPGGATSFAKPFAITAANVTTIESVIAGVGVTASVSTAPTNTGGTASGISATVLNSGDETPVTLSAASYSSNPSPSTAFDVAGNSELAGNFLDLQVTGADPEDQLAANFYYPFEVTGTSEDNLTLKYFNGSSWVDVISSGGVPLEKTRRTIWMAPCLVDGLRSTSMIPVRRESRSLAEPFSPWRFQGRHCPSPGFSRRSEELIRLGEASPSLCELSKLGARSR